MKKTTISIIVLSIILTIAAISGIWTFVLKNPVNNLKEDILSKKADKHLPPTQENILMWILDHQTDSLEAAVQHLKHENPGLSKKIKQYLKSQKKTNNRLFAQVEKEEKKPEVHIIQQETEHPVKEAFKEVKKTEPEEIIEETIVEEGPAKKLINTQYLRFKVDGVNVYYIGDIVDGKAQGQGKGVFDNGIVYEGLWSNNQRDGKGMQKWTDGSVYDGYFSNNKRSGKGTFTNKSNEKYIGEWLNDKRHGEGTLYDRKGKVRYKGEWKADLFIN